MIIQLMYELVFLSLGKIQLSHAVLNIFHLTLFILLTNLVFVLARRISLPGTAVALCSGLSRIL